MRRAIGILLGGSFEAFPKQELMSSDGTAKLSGDWVENFIKPTEDDRSLSPISKRFDTASEAIRQTQKDGLMSMTNVVSTQHNGLTGQRQTT